jgi:hypothetical protein
MVQHALLVSLAEIVKPTISRIHLISAECGPISLLKIPQNKSTGL